MRLAALLAGLALAAGSAADTLHLPLGDPARRDRTTRVQLDAITDTRTGEVLSPAELARRLADTRILFLGEEHTSVEHHRVQLHVLRALVDSGREPILGVEMLPYTQQALLERWWRGEIAEAQFADAWYEHWSHHWGYYREIFQYARERKLPLVALNVPREAVRVARSQGFEALDATTRAHLPPAIDATHEEFRRLFDASFASDDPLHGALAGAQREGLYRAQAMWDAALGWNAAQALEKSGRERAVVVVLLGTGHMAYGLGAERQLASHFKGPVRSLVAVHVRAKDARAEVQSSYADYVWGVPAEGGPVYPVLGVSLAGNLGSDPTRVIQVEKGSSAERAGVQVGDILVSANGAPLQSSVSLPRALADFAWGDVMILELRRGNNTLRLPVAFRRTAAAN
ncbi:MAG TPA: ChaN family lipoprotein [Steroidobacteraceae bacterium]|nr:ChaN family lipoprotein [Steroidobacteraceae bacterium]